MNLDHYLHKEVYESVDRSVYQNNLLRDMDKVCHYAMDKPFPDFSYDSMSSMMMDTSLL